MWCLLLCLFTGTTILWVLTYPEKCIGGFMAILMNNVMNNEVRGFNAVANLRQAVVNKLYEQSIVIRKFTVSVDMEGEAHVSFKYGTIGMNPVAVAFGLDYDVRLNNLPVEVKLENDKTEARKVNVDGHKYIFCTSLITIECEDEQKINELAADGFVFGDNVYRAAGSSPSNEKHAVKFYYKVTDKIDTEVKAFNIMDEVAGKVFSAKFAKLLNGKAITKMNTRLGNYLTTMLSLAQIDLSKDYIAVVHEEKDENGKVTKDGSIVGAYDFDEATIEAMDKAGIEIDNHINDGANYYATDVIVEMAANVGVKMTHKDALKVAVQNRATYLTGKTMSRTLTRKQLVTIAEANNAVYYGNTNGRLLALFDEDGAKLINTAALKNEQPVIDIYVMAIAKASTVRTSGQHLIKYMSVDEETTIKFMKKAMNGKLDEFFLNKLNNEAVMNSVNAKLIAALGDEAVKNTALMETIISDTIKYATSAIAKTKVDIAGVYSHMMFDLTYALTEGRVDRTLGITKDGFVEAYSEDVLRTFKNEIAAIENNNELTEDEKDEQLFQLLSGVVIKYPSAMPKEYEIVVYLTKKQIERRIKAATKDNDDRKTLREYFNNTPYGCTVYAPINAMKNKLAGADVDFDATMTDMSALKFILIDQRIKENETRPGFMGYCTFISYKDINRDELQADENDDIEL
jgi:hypothetical protein